MNEDVVTTEDVEDVLNFHRDNEKSVSEADHLCATINYALDKFLSRVVDKMKEEDREDNNIRR